MAKSNPLSVLIVEESPADSHLIESALGQGGLETVCQRVDSEADYLARLADKPDIVLSDYDLPQFSALQALSLLRERQLDIPFIIVSGSSGEEIAVDAIHQGAADYVLKDSLGRLGQAVTRALEQQRLRCERMQLEEQHRQAQKLESIGQLAAGIAHEINTPIQYVSDNVAFLKKVFADVQGVLDMQEHFLHRAKGGTLDEHAIAAFEQAVANADLDYLKKEVPRAIDQTLDGVNRVAKIVRAMKEFAHPANQGKAAADLNRLIDNTITVAKGEWKDVAEIVRDFDPDLPLVRCIASEFYQVILNLIVNAAYAIGDRLQADSGQKGVITITTRALDNAVEIRVKDTGTGIPIAARAKIFDPFFSTKSVGKGMGQGLTTAYAVIVKRHGGSLTFETEMGQGSTFIIRLPISSGSTFSEARPPSPS